MPVRLSPADEETLAGKHGEARRLALSIVVRMADVEGAEELMDVTRAHIDGALYMGESSVEFAERFVELGGRVRIPTTLNIGSVDARGWREYPVPEEFATKARRIMQAYEGMGCQPTWTCAPYQVGVRPAFGEQVAWAESNAIVFANSALGARTNRYGDYMDICAALTGRVPKSGLHLVENRRGQIVFRLAALQARLLRDDSLYAALGIYVGGAAGQRIPVLEGLPPNVTEDQLKALGAAAASSGCVALFHAVGVTPEAPTLEAALQGKPPEEVVDVDLGALRSARDRLSTGAPEALDAVLLGCPHFSTEEFGRLAASIRGRERDPRVQVVVTTSRAVRTAVQSSAIWPELSRFGVRLVVDTCVLHQPTLGPSARVLMTNSGKLAYYSPGILGRQVVFGSLGECVESAVRGRVYREDVAWEI